MENKNTIQEVINPDQDGPESAIDLSPEDIAEMINEDIRPGTLGLSEDEGKDAPPNGTEILKSCANLAQHIDRFADDLLKYAQEGDVRKARLCLAEIYGAVSQAKTGVETLAKHLGLPDIKV